MKKMVNAKDYMVCIAGLICFFLLMGNTNHVPDWFADRLFRPLTGEYWTFHYVGFIIIIGIYFCFRRLNQLRETPILSTRWRRILATFIFMTLSANLWTIGIQVYKGFSNDLNAIYLERDRSLIDISGNESGGQVRGEIQLKNCSKTEQHFKVKIKIPNTMQEIVGSEYIELETEYVLYPNSKQRFSIDDRFVTESGSPSYGMTSYSLEYIFYNDESEVVFKRSMDEEYFDR